MMIQTIFARRDRLSPPVPAGRYSYETTAATSRCALVNNSVSRPAPPAPVFLVFSRPQPTPVIGQGHPTSFQTVCGR